MKLLSTRKFRAAEQAGQLDGLGVAMGFPAHVMRVAPVARAKPTESDVEARQLLFTISTEGIDRYGDVIEAEGWDLKLYRKNPVVLFGHNYGNNVAPVVGNSLNEWVDKKKLRSVMEFTPEGMIPLADMLFQLYAGGWMHATSVGFVPKKWDYREPEDDERYGGYIFQAQELVEYSLVPVPANGEALIGAKSAGIELSPLHEWSEKILDEWREVGYPMPRKMLKDIHDQTAKAPSAAPAAAAAAAEEPGPADVESIVAVVRYTAGRTREVAYEDLVRLTNPPATLETTIAVDVKTLSERESAVLDALRRSDTEEATNLCAVTIVLTDGAGNVVARLPAAGGKTPLVSGLAVVTDPKIGDTPIEELDIDPADLLALLRGEAGEGGMIQVPDHLADLLAAAGVDLVEMESGPE